MNLLEGFAKSLKKLKETWVTPEEQSSAGGLTLRTPDGKTEVTVIITNTKDARTAKQIANLLLTENEPDFEIGFTD